MKELQSLALDVRVQDRDGNDIELSELCRDDDLPKFTKADRAAIDEVIGNNVDDGSVSRSFLLEDEDGNPLEEDEEDDLFATESDVAEYEDEFFGDDAE